MQDKIIRKKVYRIWGTIPLSNYIQMPAEKGGCLGVTGEFADPSPTSDPNHFRSRVATRPTGRYLYAQLRVIPSKYFAVHFDVLTADR